MCIGKNPMLNPVNMTQKLTRHTRSFIKRPVNFGNQ